MTPGSDNVLHLPKSKTKFKYEKQLGESGKISTNQNLDVSKRPYKRSADVK
jgi:hypothetical protein